MIAHVFLFQLDVSMTTSTAQHSRYRYCAVGVHCKMRQFSIKELSHNIRIPSSLETSALNPPSFLEGILAPLLVMLYSL